MNSSKEVPAQTTLFTHVCTISTPTCAVMFQLSCGSPNTYASENFSLSFVYICVSSWQAQTLIFIEYVPGFTIHNEPSYAWSSLYTDFITCARPKPSAMKASLKFPDPIRALRMLSGAEGDAGRAGATPSRQVPIVQATWIEPIVKWKISQSSKKPQWFSATGNLCPS